MYLYMLYIITYLIRLYIDNNYVNKINMIHTYSLHYTNLNYKLVSASKCGILLTTILIVNNLYTFTQTKYDTH